MVSVGAHDANGQRAEFSPDAEWVDLTAPGTDVVSLFLDGMVRFSDRADTEAPPDSRFDGFASWSGTSFAAAAVTGAIARRIGSGMTGRGALDDLMQQPAANSEGIWRFRATNALAVTKGLQTTTGGYGA